MNKNLRDTLIIGDATKERMTAVPERRVTLTGISETQAPYRIIRTCPDFGQVLVCTGGEGMVWREGSWQKCTKGMVLLTPPSHTSAYYTALDSVWEIAWVHLIAEIEMPWPDDVLMVKADTEPFCNVILGLYRESIGAADTAHLLVWSELLLLEARRLLRGNGSQPDRLRSIWEAVEQNLTYPWTSNDLAQRAFLSEGQLRVVCQQATGRSTMEQVTFLRMRRAAALLISANYTIQQVAEAVGYTNPYAFSTAFKRVIGMPPSQYRR
jgi:AraC-like DNA-binding protein